ncbi:MAG: hypothetical protein KGI59_00945 [Patescibacteria group bacterium]|nr:hypothetical protein [Patescibacteria group bacterium]MDE2172389.1 hypothetical protein [Patescibacteria group bacterium]
MYTKTSQTRGYTLLFAIIVSSIVLSVAAFILEISRKQFILSTASRDSTVAIYAADTGIQCAVKAYAAVGQAAPGSSFPIECRGINPAPSGTFAASVSYPNGVNFNPATVLATPPIIVPLGSSCAKIQVWEGNELSASAGHIIVIRSSGYNLYDPNNPGVCPEQGPRDEERVIQLVEHD